MPADRARSETEAANLALSHIREPGITDLAEDTHRARVVTKHFGTTRDDLLRGGNYNFATWRFTPAQDPVESDGPLKKRYPLPDDCLKVRDVDGLEADEWEVEGGETGGLDPVEARFLVTNADAPVIVGTRRITNVSLWDVSFVRAFKIELAAVIAPEIARSDKIADKAAEQSKDAEDRAAIRDARERAPSQISRETSWVRARRGMR